MTRRTGFVLLLLLFAAPCLAASGVKGRVAWRGELVPGVQVRAYRAVADIAADKPVATSELAALDGTYRLDLPPGSYFLTARDFDGGPQPGRHFCYYSGAPVRVTGGSYTNVGFNLIRIPEEAPPAAGYTGLRGEISYRDEPLEKVYLYVYRDPSGGFKGPGYQILPVERGSFRLRLPPGEYYLLARKRQKGGRFGPIEIGDYFNYYHGNPITIVAGQTREVKIDTISRLSMLEEGEEQAFSGVRGVVMGAGNRPAAGVRVFAYTRSQMTGTPEFFSAPSNADGAFELKLPATGTYYLLARESFGGPAAEGELYGRFTGNAEHSVRLAPQQPIREVTIHVEPQE